ncbi:hypothetical protein COOONC_11788 [Cooperia oncophora]
MQFLITQNTPQFTNDIACCLVPLFVTVTEKNFLDPAGYGLPLEFVEVLHQGGAGCRSSEAFNRQRHLVSKHYKC